MHVRRLDNVAIEIYDKTPVKIAVGAIERVGERGRERERAFFNLFTLETRIKLHL